MAPVRKTTARGRAQERARVAGQQQDVRREAGKDGRQAEGGRPDSGERKAQPRPVEKKPGK